MKDTGLTGGQVTRPPSSLIHQVEAIFGAVAPSRLRRWRYQPQGGRKDSTGSGSGGYSQME